MGVIALDRVHWVLIAVLLGLAFGLVFDQSDGRLYGIDAGGYGLLLSRQQQFENGLIQEYDHIRLFSDPVVYPHWIPEPSGAKKVYLITGRYWDGNAQVKDGKSVGEWVPRCVITQTPYRPQTAVVDQGGKNVTEFPSVVEFLDAMHRLYGVTYRYAWWAAHPMLTWFIATVIVIGGIWPTVINLLAFGRWTRPPQIKTLSLWNVVSRTPPRKTSAPSFVASPAPDLDAEIGAAMASGASPNATAEAPATLSRGPLELLPEAPKEAREYDAKPDDFYPTERHKIGGRHPGSTATPEHDDQRGCARGGFSLVELLVVIGVIAILIALLLPALRMARESAGRIKCASQLRQLGYAFQMYANENKGSLPGWSGWHTWPPEQPEDTEGPAWTVEMIPYIGNPDSPVYDCPAFPARVRNYFIAAIWSSVNGRNAMKLTDIKLSSQFIVSGDITQSGAYPRPYGTNNDTSDADYSDEGEPLLVFPDQGGFLMHRGGNNILFADTHVEAFTTFDPRYMSFHPTKACTWQQVHDGGPDESAGPL